MQAYGRLVGLFMGYAYTNVLAPIWKAFPGLEPLEMKTPYVESEPALMVESRRALSDFIAEAQSALDFTKKSISDDEIAEAFKYGGLTELEEALRKIKEFLAHPRVGDGNDEA